MAVAATPFASASLYVGDLNNEVTEALLFEIFNAVGPVASVRVCRDAATRRSLGYAYVNFHRLEDAERALDTMNFKNIRNRPCRIMWSHRDPSLRRSGVGNLFVKNLAPNIDNKSLYDTFSMFGNILSCKVSVDKNRNSLGYGFVHYETDEAAAQAIQKVDGKEIAGQIVTVAPFRSKKERGVESSAEVFTNVYVKNLSDETTEESLTEMFSKYGNITSLNLPASEEGKLKGFAFINYATAEEASAAVDALHDIEVAPATDDKEAKKLFVGRAQRKDEREKELRERFEQLKMERQKKYEGVNLYVKNLTDEMDEEKVREEFSKYGTVTSCKIMLDQEKKSKGFGFVCFATPAEAKEARDQLNNRSYNGKPLYVSLAQRKEVRRAQLEQQHNNRAKMGMPGQMPPQMYPPQAPMFYAPGIPPTRQFMYPGQMVPRNARYPPNGNPGMMGPGARYQLMPVPNARNPQGQGPRQGGQRNRRNNNGPNMQGQRRNMQGQPMMQQPRETAPAENPSAVVPATTDQAAPLTIKQLAAAPEGAQKQMIGERLYPLIHEQQPSRAGKITGMLLEMDNGELIHLLESRDALNEKVQEAIAVLQHATE